MAANIPEFLPEIAAYYTRRLAEHGCTARGVDWNGEASQRLRFEQIARILPTVGEYSLVDLGCGYGALHDYLVNARRTPRLYVGYDVSASMVAAARQRTAGFANVRFKCGGVPDETADFAVASGILNVRLGVGDEEWWVYVKKVIEILDRCGNRGFAFNCLTSYSDPEFMEPSLYYADPLRIFDHCKRRYARNVALLHDYGLYEFTILSRKST